QLQQQYPHNLLKPLPLILNSRGRRVITFDHFVNNDLEYLRGGASSRKYTTSVTKTKAADYGHIKWIEDLVPQTMWIQESMLSRESPIGGANVNSSTILLSTGSLLVMSTQNVESSLSLNSKLSIKECFAFNVSLRMFKRSIVIQRRVEDLQLGVAYSNPRGFIYQNKDKQNRLMRIDELHKFSDGMLIDVRTALDARLKGIQMKLLLKRIRAPPDFYMTLH
nr:hypothetical protein [Tanacetum cinerariifolium]